jgi:hypothetical protein
VRNEKKPQIPRHAGAGSPPHCALSKNISTRGPRNCRSLGFPGFPVESCGFGQLHVVLFRENHISGAAESSEVGNPGTLGMTKERATVPERVVAGPKRFFITLGDPRTHDSSGRDDKVVELCMAVHRLENRDLRKTTL